MFELAKALGVTPQHIADFVKVTRITASGWVNGHTKPHTILADRIEKFNSALKSAEKSGDLPLSPDITMRKRRKCIYEVLHRHANNNV